MNRAEVERLLWEALPAGTPEPVVTRLLAAIDTYALDTYGIAAERRRVLAEALSGRPEPPVPFPLAPPQAEAPREALLRDAHAEVWRRRRDQLPIPPELAALDSEYRAIRAGLARRVAGLSQPPAAQPGLRRKPREEAA